MGFKVPLFDITFDDEEIEAVSRVLRSGWLTMGLRNQDLEREFAELIELEYAVAVNNGTAALHLACVALGLGPGDEVVTTPLTFVATANAVHYTGAKPVFADIIGAHDFNIDPASIERLLTPRTKAISVVHYGGFPCDMEAITDIAVRHNLKVIEDASHAPGVRHGDKMIGGWGDIGCFSFYSNKNMVTGEGGMVTCRDPELDAQVRRLRCHAMTAHTLDRHHGPVFEYDVIDVGYNYRMDEMRAALGLCQLRKLMAANARREELTLYYRQALAKENRLLLPYTEAKASAYHIFPVLLPPGANRPAFMSAMRERGVQTSIHYRPVHQMTVYRHLYPGLERTCPRAEEVGLRQVTLPLYPQMTEDMVDYVCQSARESLDVAS